MCVTVLRDLRLIHMNGESDTPENVDVPELREVCSHELTHVTAVKAELLIGACPRTATSAKLKPAHWVAASAAVAGLRPVLASTRGVTSCSCSSSSVPASISMIGCDQSIAHTCTDGHAWRMYGACIELQACPLQ